MKKIFVLGVAVILLFTSSYFPLSIDEIENLDAKGILRDFRLGVYGSNVVTEKETAIKIAEAVARDLYGDRVGQHLPFTVEELPNDPPEWKVEGTAKKYGNFRIVGGPEVHIRKYDGAVTFITFWR